MAWTTAPAWNRDAVPAMNQRTKPVTLVLLAIVGAAIAWVAEIWVVGTGLAMFVAPITMPITLAAVALVLLVIAWPVRAYTRALRRQRDEHADARGHHSDDDPDAAHGRDGDADRGRRGRDGRRDEEPTPKRVDPVYAVRVLAFAKASSLAGAVLGGACAAVLVFVLTRPVIADALLPSSIIAVVGAFVLLVAGLVAESWCLLPPDGRDGQRETAPSRPLLGA